MTCPVLYALSHATWFASETTHHAHATAQVQELLQTADHNNKKQPLTMAKLAGGKEMESSVQRHQNNLKVLPLLKYEHKH